MTPGVRLLLALQSPDAALIIGPGILHERLYRIMCGKNGNALYSLATKNSNLVSIDRA